MTREQIRGAIRQFIASQEGAALPIDTLRMIEEEAMLMKEQEALVEMLDTDPFEHFSEYIPQVASVRQRLQLTSCSRERAGPDYCRIHAVVTFESCNNLQLTFHYKRTKKVMEGSSQCHIWYSIEMSENYGPKEHLLVAQVWAPKNEPTTTAPAVSMQNIHGDEDDEDDADVDMMADDPSGRSRKSDEPKTTQSNTSSPSKKATKKQKLSSDPSIPAEDDEDKKPAEHDTFMGFMNPEVLEDFLTKLNLKPMDEATAFFMLMTFPFYEHEWDIVGYVLDDVFGAEDDDDEEGDGGDEGSWSDVSASSNVIK